MVNVKGLGYIKCTLVVIQISMGGGVLSMTPLSISLKNRPFSMPRAFVSSHPWGRIRWVNKEQYARARTNCPIKVIYEIRIYKVICDYVSRNQF